MASSDVELLLEEPERPQQASFARRVAVALSLVGLSALAILAYRGEHGPTKSGSNNFVSLSEDCFEYGTFYASPHKMMGTDRTSERSKEACQARCANFPGCAHFSYWPDGGCMITGSESRAKAAPPRFHATVSGPSQCGGSESAPESASISVGVPSDISDGANGGLLPPADGGLDISSSGLLESGSSGLVTDFQRLGAGPEDSKPKAVPTVLPADIKAVPTQLPAKIDATAEAPTLPPVKMLSGVNGTMCSKYPACVAVGIKEGSCCPTEANVNLGCCIGIQEGAADGSKVSKDAECSIYPACMKLGLTGACCPAPNGAKLGCCDGA